jgi:hypothetical protein
MNIYLVEYSLEILEHNSGELPRAEKRYTLVYATSSVNAAKAVEKHYANLGSYYRTYTVTIIGVSECLKGD